MRTPRSSGLNKPHPALLLALSRRHWRRCCRSMFIGDGQDAEDRTLRIQRAHRLRPVHAGESFTPGEAVVMKKNENFFIEGYPDAGRDYHPYHQGPELALLIAMENGESGFVSVHGSASNEVKRLREGRMALIDHAATVTPLSARSTGWRSIPRPREAVGCARSSGDCAMRPTAPSSPRRCTGASPTPQRGPIIESVTFLRRLHPRL